MSLQLLRAGNRKAGVNRGGVSGAEPPSSSEITQSVVAEYVDTSGNLQFTTLTEGATITGVAPFLVHFNALGTRSTDTNADDEPGAYYNIGTRWDWDEQVGETWSLTGRSKAQDVGGPPIIGRAFVETGAHTVRCRQRDTLGNEATLTFTVQVNAPPTATLIPVSAGSWPSFSSGSHYTLEAGGNYSSFGTLSCNGLHNIVFSKTGSGADPIIPNFAPEGRAFVTSSPLPRARHIRIKDIDTGRLTMNTVGFVHCGAVGGRVRGIGSPNYTGSYNFVGSSQRPYFYYPRGVFLWDCGEVTATAGSNGQYVWIDAARRLHVVNCDFHKEGSAGNHCVRMGGDQSAWRNTRFRSSVSAVTLYKSQGEGFVAWDQSSDNVGDGVSSATGYTHEKNYHWGCIYNATGSSIPQIGVTWEPQNDTSAEGVQLCVVEDSVSAQSSIESLGNFGVWMGGRNVGVRNLRGSNGTGSYFTGLTAHHDGALPPEWQGPYIQESANSRPVPSAF